MDASLFVKKIREYIAKEELLEENDKVVLGVSGGADSVALLYVMNALRDEFSLSLLVVSVDHGLRAAAKEECNYVRSLCESMNIPFVLKSYDVAGLAQKSGKGTEETGRKVRYEAFDEAAASLGEGTKIAVAHNMNDLAETMLFHLFRGTGPKGLCSIIPKRGNIIRPLLCVERREIEAWLNGQGYPYYTDATNLTDDYTRNMIRHNIIDYAVNNINDNSISHMYQTAEMLRALTRYAESEVDALFESACKAEKDGIVIDAGKLPAPGENSYIVRSLFKKCIDLTVPHNRDITLKHLSAIENLYAGSEAKRLDLPYSITVLYESGHIIFRKGREDGAVFDSIELTGESGVLLTPFDITVKWHVEPKPEGFKPFKNEYTKCFDYDKIHSRPMLRTAREGDYITINDKLQKKKLSDYFIDEKVPLSKRKSTLLIADGSNVLWVIGHRMGEYGKVSDSTGTILVIEAMKEENDG